MPRTSPFTIELSAAEERELRRRAAKYTLPYFEVVRARMILLAAEGLSNDQIAARLDAQREVVSMWRKRFFEDRLAGLEELPRPGRPRVFPPQNWWCRSRLSPVNSLPPTAFRSRTGTRRTSPGRSANQVWPPLSPAAQFGAGSIRMLFGLGITVVGSFRATRSSPLRPAASSTCMPALGMASRCERTSS